MRSAARAVIAAIVSLAVGCASTIVAEHGASDASANDVVEASNADGSPLDRGPDVVNACSVDAVVASDAPDDGSVYVRDIACTLTQCCALMSDGTVRCLGDNAHGELGDGTTVERIYTPVVVAGLSSVIEVSVNDEATCALLRDGTVRCLGDNEHGDVGDGSSIDRHAPVMVPGLVGVGAISSGAGGTCARSPLGTVSCWGSDYGLVPRPVDRVAGVVELAISGATGVCGLRADRHVRCAALDAERSFATVGDGVQIASGYSHLCVRRVDGTVRCWGYNGRGQLGDGSTESYPTVAVDPGLGCVAQIAPGAWHTCARMSDGTVQCWGSNGNGELGDGTLIDRHAPGAVPGLTDVVKLAMGESLSCALRRDHGVLCWGTPLWMPGHFMGNLTRPTSVAW